MYHPGLFSSGAVVEGGGGGRGSLNMVGRQVRREVRGLGQFFRWEAGLDLKQSRGGSHYKFQGQSVPVCDCSWEK